MKYTPEDLTRIQNEIDANIEAQRQLMSERAYNDNVISLAHVKACTAAGIDPKLGPEDTKEAKLYSRGRAFALQHKAWNFVENQLDDPNAKPSMKAWAADIVFSRSVGPIDTPNEIKADLNAMTPLEAIEHIMTELTAGNITPKYADSLVKTQAARIQGFKLEDLAKAHMRIINAQPNDQSSPAIPSEALITPAPPAHSSAAGVISSSEGHQSPLQSSDG